MNIASKHLVTFFIILLLHGFILTKLIFFPYPELFIYPYLTNHGLKPYSQILDQHFPGIMFLPINLDNLGMNNEVSARFWLIGLVLLTQTLIFFISNKIFRDSKKALFACIFYLIWQPFLEGWMLWIDSFLPLFLLPAFYFCYGCVNNKFYKLNFVFLTGLFLGFAILFKQMAIPLAALVFFLLFFYKRSFKVIGVYFTGLLPVPSLMVLYVYHLGVLRDFWFWTVTFNLTTFAKFGNKPPYLSGIIRVVFVYCFIFLSYFSDQRKLTIVLLAFIIGGLSGDIARFDLVHFQTSLPFVALLSVEVLSKMRGVKYKLLFGSYTVISIYWLLTFYKGHLSDQVLFFDNQTRQVIAKVKDYTQLNEHIFLYGVSPHIYQQTQTLPTGNIFVFQFPWFLKETDKLLLDALAKTPPKLILRDRSLEIEGKRLIDYSKDINNFIDGHYVQKDMVGNVEFLQYKE